MAKRRRGKSKHSASPAGDDPAASAPPGGREQRVARAEAGWFQTKRPILGFVLQFGIFMGVFYVVMTRPLLKERVFPAYLDLNASASAWILTLVGQEVTASGKSISSPQASLQIMRGCDAIEPTALFVAAVLATPVAVWAKLFGALGGTVLLAAINLLRIVTLFVTRVHFPKAFELMHVEVWQGLFICLSLVLWIAWAVWATKPRTVKGDDSSQSAP